MRLIINLSCSLVALVITLVTRTHVGLIDNKNITIGQLTDK